MSEIKETNRGMTASESFQVHSDNAKVYLVLISKKITELKKQEKKSPKDWGHSGSMGKVEFDLKGVLNFMEGTAE